MKDDYNASEDYANNLSDAQNEANQNAVNALQSGTNQSSAAEVGQSILAGTNISNTADTSTTNANNQTDSLLKRLTLALKGEEAQDQTTYIKAAGEATNEAEKSSTLADIFSLLGGLLKGDK